MFNDIGIQLWSGVWGAIFGAILGGIFTLLILWITIVSQKGTARAEATRESEAATARLNQQVTDAAARLEQQKTDSSKQLSDQREEKRETREFEAVSELLEFLTALQHDKPRDFAFVRELVRLCDRLTLSSNTVVGEDWKTTESGDRLGATRHPLAQSLAIILALEQVGPAMVALLDDLYNHELPFQFRMAVRRTMDPMVTLDKELNSLASSLLSWQNLRDDEKKSQFDGIQTVSTAGAVKLLIVIERLLHLDQEVGTRRLGTGFLKAHGDAEDRFLILQLAEPLRMQSDLITIVARGQWDVHGPLQISYAEVGLAFRAKTQRVLENDPSADIAWNWSLRDPSGSSGSRAEAR